MKIRVWIFRIIMIVIALFLLILSIAVIASKLTGKEQNIFGYELKSVLSGSMEPTFLTGSIIAIKTGGDMTGFQPGDVITFMKKENVFVTHRIIEVIHDGENVLYRTKGDFNNNADGDLVNSSNVIGKYTGFTIPYAGYFFAYASTNIGSALLLIIPGLLLIGNSTFSFWRELSKIEKNKYKITHD